MDMKRVTQHLRNIGVLTFLVALAAATIPLPKATQAQAAGSAPVTVVNTPLPVNLTGTGNISGNVNAAQSGAWNVGVTNMPAMQLAPGTTVGISGGFSNTATSPIFTQDVDEPAKNAYVVGLCATSKFQTCPGVTVPFGTRYVIEQVSGECNVGSESSIGGFKLTAHLNGADNVYFFHDKISAGSGDTTVGPFFQESRIYSDGGVENGISAIVFDAGGSGPGAACSITLSGHLVSMDVVFPTAH
jgi:hypothetical protein